MYLLSEAAKILVVSPSRLYHLKNKGNLTCCLINGRYYISHDEIYKLKKYFQEEIPSEKRTSCSQKEGFTLDKAYKLRNGVKDFEVFKVVGNVIYGRIENVAVKWDLNGRCEESNNDLFDLVNFTQPKIKKIQYRFYKSVIFFGVMIDIPENTKKVWVDSTGNIIASRSNDPRNVHIQVIATITDYDGEYKDMVMEFE